MTCSALNSHLLARLGCPKGPPPAPIGTDAHAMCVEFAERRKLKLQQAAQRCLAKAIISPLFSHLEGQRCVDDPQDAHALAPELIAAFPAFYSSNLWPEELAELELAFKEACACIIDVGVLVARHCSRCVHATV